MKSDLIYWNGRGEHQELAEKLEAMIPASGSVVDPTKNPALEKFRKASNCYYDLYNNGLCNCAKAFAKVFGIASSRYRHMWDHWKFTQDLYDKTEEVMSEIVLAAAKEQGLTDGE